MCGENVTQRGGSAQPIVERDERLNNMLRTATMLEKAIDRVLRNNYFYRNQYPKTVEQIEEAFTNLRSWINEYSIFSSIPGFSLLAGTGITDIGEMIEEIMALCKPSPGKKEIKKEQRMKEHRELRSSIYSMLGHIAGYFAQIKENQGALCRALERALEKAFEEHYLKKQSRRDKWLLSTRGEKSYIFPWEDKEGYSALVNDRERFRIEVVEKLDASQHATGHKPSCKGQRKYRLIGFRRNNRKTVLLVGEEGEFRIRMVECISCGQKFSLLPSFLPREKHFVIDLIGRVFQNMVLFSQSIQAVLENLKIGPRCVKSKQTIFNWLRWMGALHPAVILTRAGVKGSGYLQEDEGFEKEPHLRTYSVVMVDPKNLLVWHADYVDRVDEESLCASFEKFARSISFKILGVTKDKWEAATKALKTVFYRIWIGFCHRHCLKKFWQALLNYQQETGCSQTKVSSLYKQFKKVMHTSTSAVSLTVNLKRLDDEAFKHPLLRERVRELEKNAVHYTVNKNRQGITKTTSIVDNFLKLVKRKLTMAESFRDQHYARILFQAMANTRNFVPFLSGAKNAHKSPFMLAQGQTYNLPWMQVMNVHNAFLFTPNAF